MKNQNNYCTATASKFVVIRGAAARGEANICLCVDTEELKTVFDSLFKLLVFPFIGKFHLQSCFFDNDIFLTHLKSVHYQCICYKEEKYLTD